MRRSGRCSAKLYAALTALRSALAPLRDVEDLVRLELGLLRFAKVHRSLRSKRLVSAVRTILGAAVDYLQGTKPN